MFLFYVFLRCVELKGLYERWSGNKLKEEDKKLVLKEKFLEYIQLLVQQNRLLLAKQICNKFLQKSKIDGDKAVLGYHTPKLIIIYEDILRQNMNDMTKNCTEDVIAKMDSKRNVNGPNYDQKETETENESESKQNDNNDSSKSKIKIKDLPEKIWELRKEMDNLYSEGIKLSPSDTTLHIAYALALWRIGYNAEGIEKKTNSWTKCNQDILKIAQYHLARANALMNVDENKKAMIELQNALKCCDDKDKDKDDEVQTRLLMAVTYNKINKLDLAKIECEYILKIPGNDKHEGTLKMYAAILQRMKKYKKSKQIYIDLLTKNPKNATIITEYISLLIEMKEYKEAKQRLQQILMMNPENALELMYSFAVVSYKLKEYDAAERTFISIIGQNPKKFEGAFINLINIYREQINDIEEKLKQKDDKKIAKAKGNEVSTD